MNRTLFPDEAMTPLSAEGLQQCDEVGDSLKAALAEGPVYIYHSPNPRAVQTKDGIVQRLAGVEVQTAADHKLRQKDAGLFYGFSKEERKQHWPELVAKNEMFVRNHPFGKFIAVGPEAESLHSVYERSKKFHDVIRKKHKPADNIAIISHDAVLESYRNHVTNQSLLHTPPRMAYGAILLIEGPDWETMKETGVIHPGRISHTDKIKASRTEDKGSAKE